MLIKDRNMLVGRSVAAASWTAIVSALLYLGLASTAARAADRVEIDEWDMMGAFAPMYARVMDNLESDYVPIVFYRNPACVRPGFNLLLTFDIPFAFACLPLTVHGAAIFEDRTGDPFAPPFQSIFSGNSVPFAFVARSDYEAIAWDADGLTYAELAPYAILGTASYYREVLQPTGGTAVVPFLNIVANGALGAAVDADGDGDMDSTFRFRVTAQFFDGVTPSARVFTVIFD